MDVIKDLEALVEELRMRPEAERNDLAYIRFLTLSDVYRPQRTTPSQDDELKAEIAGMSGVEAVKHVRERMGIGLREAKDMTERLGKDTSWRPPVKVS